MNHKLISSPLQGFTDFHFRNAFQKYFRGIDIFYAPYIRFNGEMVIKPIYDRDLQPKNNTDINLIPQVMTCSAEEFIFAAIYVISLGYNELNWNLGCPYPMVTNKGMGSGLIKDPDKIDRILDAVHTQTDITVSMKMRMGYYDNTEILNVFPILDKYPIKNVGIHARIGAQLYEGGVDLDGFQKCVDHCNHKLYYNGDITSLKVFEKLTERFPTIDHWMIGRGLIADPFLPDMIKNQTHHYPDNKKEIFSKYHDTLFTAAEQKLTGEKAVIRKMLSYWEYFATLYPEPSKIIKKIKKAKSYQVYDAAVAEILGMEEAS